MKTIGYFDSTSFLDQFRDKEFSGRWPDLRQFFHISVIRYPDNRCFQAFSPEEEAFTYKEAEARIEAVARYLVSQGDRKSVV